jgi:hypothetical protein
MKKKGIMAFPGRLGRRDTRKLLKEKGVRKLCCPKRK